ncbi:MAG: trypsin-like peptidase domain-containing protein [Paracoccaceae bacterium]
MIRILFLWLVLLASPPATAETRVPQNALEMQLSFAPLVKQAAPAVVNIYASRVTTARASPFQSDPFFGRFFEQFGQPQPRVQNSLGSGVILSASGIVVSNYHVVGMATDIRVVLADRREFEAHVLLGDRNSDLAILKLEGARDLPSLSLRDSDGVEVGELALAIGNPFGVGQTVSSGIISGLARSGGASGAGRGYFIQTDAPINPGNSGGALVDIHGKLIGVNTSILTRSGGSNGIGFAIPANLVKAFVDQARAGQSRFQRPWAGMSGQPVGADLAESLNLDVPGGVLISATHPASPFLAAGFRVGDVITSVAGAQVNTPAEMVFRMSVSGLDRKVPVTRWRDGTASDIPVQLIVAPEDPPRAPVTLGRRESLPGLTVATINPAVISEYELSLEAAGVLITDPNTAGRRIGLRRGDVILTVNGEAILRPQDVQRILRRSDWTVTMDVLRGNQRVGLSFRR